MSAESRTGQERRKGVACDTLGKITSASRSDEIPVDSPRPDGIFPESPRADENVMKSPRADQTTVQLSPGERHGRWRNQQSAKQLRARASVNRAINAWNPKILLDSGDNISLLSARMTEKARLSEVIGRAKQCLFKASATRRFSHDTRARSR